jgi:alpha-methylacyl-CoA racemase
LVKVVCSAQLRRNSDGKDDAMTTNTVTNGRPLDGVKVLDLSALGPGPFCSMLLADYGAEVVSVVRPDPEPFDPAPMFSRGKRTVVVNLRADGGTDVLRRMASTADVFLEGFRPGTMERRGLGPEQLLADNPRLVYARLTGYGQSGPYAMRAGHDINYISIGGPLGAIGRTEPIPPLNIVGDFGGGSVNAAMGIVLALFERERTGRGRVIDAAMVDGAALLLMAQVVFNGMGQWDGLGTSSLSGNAPYYGTYRCSDGKWFAVGAIEERFYVQLVDHLGLDRADLADRDDPANWPRLRSLFADRFASESRDHWTKVFGDSDACGTPVLEVGELGDDPHLRERRTIVECDGLAQPSPAPRLGDPGAPPEPFRVALRPTGPTTRTVLADYGFSDAEIEGYAQRGALPDVG